ncbi:hypothetical protein NF701_07070 [Sphingomonadaceae bacterium OTU29THOMA1]|nr:hypothetical protein NF701_07070 [Sphingomonadaceae bacterium OTU29THOMA1]
MDYKKIGFGLGAFAAGAVAWTAAAAAFGPQPGSRRPASNGDDTGAGAVPGDSTTAPIAPRPATMAAAPVGMAETEKHFQERPGNPAAEHVPTDLMGDTHPGNGTRAVDAFRPDPMAVPTEQEREALRPATGPAPTLVADRGSGFSEGAGAA